MKRIQLRTEHAIYGLLFIIAGCFRLILLGHQPLGENEAKWALQAARELPVGGNPSYLIFTRLLFDVFGSSNFLARLWPAVVGSTLVFMPLLFRRWLGWRGALIMAAGLAIDPGLAELSRQAGSSIPAVTLFLLAIGTWLGGYAILTGILGALALLSGSALWPGLIVLALAWFVARGKGGFFSGRRSISDAIQSGSISLGPTEDGLTNLSGGDGQLPVDRIGVISWKKALLAAGITLVLAGTAFLTQPWGLGSAVSSIPEYLTSWISETGMPFVPFTMILPFYEILPLLLGLVGAVRSLIRQQPLDNFLLVWFIAAAVLALANPGRQPEDWAWSLIPLWGLAAREIDRHLRLTSEEVIPTLVQFGVGMLVLLFTSLTFANLLDAYQLIAPDPLTENRQNIQWVILAGAVLLLILTSYLIAWGWAAPATMRGLVWAGMIILAAFTISSTSRATGIALTNSPELFQGGIRPGQFDLLTATMDNLSRWNTGFPGTLDADVVSLDTPGLRWALRKAANVRYTGIVEPGSKAAFILTPADEQPGLASAYRGQDFSITMETQWPNTLIDWLRWAVFRRVPQAPERIILWARGDLFADGKASPIPAVTP